MHPRSSLALLVLLLPAQALAGWHHMHGRAFCATATSADLGDVEIRVIAQQDQFVGQVTVHGEPVQKHPLRYRMPWAAPADEPDSATAADGVRCAEAKGPCIQCEDVHITHDGTKVSLGAVTLNECEAPPTTAEPDPDQ